MDLNLNMFSPVICKICLKFKKEKISKQTKRLRLAPSQPSPVMYYLCAAFVLTNIDKMFLLSTSEEQSSITHEKLQSKVLLPFI